MNYHYPSDINSKSKATWVLDAASAADPSANVIRNSISQSGINVVWGLGKGNFNVVKSSDRYVFTDMPYWGRWMGDNRDSCHWRIIPDALHCNWIRDYPDDRFKRLNVSIRDMRQTGAHILVCPSSSTMERFYDQANWTNRTIAELRKHTDRPIKVRHKPRANGTSGPRIATIPFEEDVRDAWAVVTLASIAGVEAACLGIPVFCHPASPCAPIGNLDLSMIEQPVMTSRNRWLNTLAYYQYTENELRNRAHLEILR